ncbi:hypothetical protein FRB95_002801 [Tulasnella sp. JGI-2019a]|nr:hypothetical protein FRB95_002801 [Tulasnella sp. JGI-2019a]
MHQVSASMHPNDDLAPFDGAKIGHSTGEGEFKTVIQEQFFTSPTQAESPMPMVATVLTTRTTLGCTVATLHMPATPTHNIPGGWPFGAEDSRREWHHDQLDVSPAIMSRHTRSPSVRIQIPPQILPTQVMIHPRSVALHHPRPSTATLLCRDPIPHRPRHPIPIPDNILLQKHSIAHAYVHNGGGNIPDDLPFQKKPAGSIEHSKSSVRDYSQ